MSISPKQLPKGKTLESIVKEECPTWKASASNIYFDKKGSAYYVLDRRQAQIDPSENFTGLSLAFS